MSPIRRHLFVCQNRRPVGSRPSCAERGSAAVLQALQGRALADPALAAEVAVTGCQCLGPCFSGVTVVVYPEGVWYGGVTVADVEEIVAEHLRGGRPVERLRRVWSEE